jgi:hypothetical protein
MKAIYVLILGALLIGCSHSYNKSQLAGDYVLNVGPGIDRLELKSDGTYLHSFQREDGAKATVNGTWELASLDGDPTVTLHDFPAEMATGGSLPSAHRKLVWKNLFDDE